MKHAGILMVQATNTGDNLDYLERKYGGILRKKNWMESLVQHQQYPLLPAEFLVETDTQQVALGFGVVFSGSTM